jgi:hypothetical protein
VDRYYGVPVCGSDVADVKHDSLRQAERPGGDLPAFCPCERNHTRYTLDQVGDEETDDQGTDMTMVSTDSWPRKGAYPMWVRRKVRSS